MDCRGKLCNSVFFAVVFLSLALWGCGSSKEKVGVDAQQDMSNDLEVFNDQGRDLLEEKKISDSGEEGIIDVSGKDVGNKSDIERDVIGDSEVLDVSGGCSKCRMGEECVNGKCQFVLKDGQVKIVRDKYGVPHVYAKDNYSLFFGAGYAQAQDHLKPMLINLLSAVARCSEFFGRKECFDLDMKAAHWNIENTSSMRFMGMEDWEKQVYDGFTDGINYYIKQHVSELGEPYDKIKVAPYMVVAFGMMVNISRAEQVLKRELQNFKSGKCNQHLPPNDGQSNEWVIGQKVSKNGHVYVQTDPHLQWYGMNQWYEIHLDGSDYNVMGATLLGCPAVVIGHNEHVAWALTSNSPDIADWYYLKLNPENPQQYWWGGGWMDFDVWHKKLKIRGEEDYHFKVYEAKQGFVFVSDNKTYALAAATYADKEDGVVAELLLLNRAKDIQDVKKAFSERQLIKWNVVAGDSKGHIMYLWNATVATRPEGVDTSCPLDGSGVGSGWKKLYSFDKLPFEKDPEDGWFQNCNTAPWKVNIHTAIKQTGYPEWVVPSNAGFGPRGRRATELITKNMGKMDFELLKTFSTDTFLKTASKVIETTIDVYNQIGNQVQDPGNVLPEIVKRLKNWDMTPDLDDTTAALFMVFGQLLKDHVPDVSMEDFPQASELTGKQKGLLLQLWIDSADTLKKNYGSMDVALRKVNVIDKGGKEFGIGTLGRLWQPLFMANCDVFKKGKCHVQSGSSYMMLTEIGPDGVVRSESTFPVSESVDPKSRHFSDITALYAKGEYKPAYFNLNDVLDNAESVTVLDTKNNK